MKKIVFCLLTFFIVLIAAFIVIFIRKPISAQETSLQPVNTQPCFIGLNFAELRQDDLLQNAEWKKSLEILKTSKLDEERIRAFFHHSLTYDKNISWISKLKFYLAGLNDRNIGIQQIAAEQLGDLGLINNLSKEYLRQKATVPLIEILNDRLNEGRSVECRIYEDMGFGADNNSLRQTIINTLGRIGDERAVRPLSYALKDSKLTLPAIVALGELARWDESKLKTELKNESFIPLVDFLQSENHYVIIEASRALQRIDPKRSFEIINNMLKKGTTNERYKAALAMGCFDDELGYNPLMEALHDNAPEVRARAVWSISHPNFRKNEMFVTTVLPLLSDASPDVRAGSAYSLSCLTDKRIPAAIFPLLKDSNPKVRNAAVQTAGRCGDKQLFKPIVELLEDDDVQVRYEALMSLAAMGDPRAIEPIKKMIKKYPEIKISADDVLERLKKQQNND